jgi:hypothetical protein
MLRVVGGGILIFDVVAALILRRVFAARQQKAAPHEMSDNEMPHNESSYDDMITIK